MNDKKTESLSAEVQKDLNDEGLGAAHVEVDSGGIAYVTGQVETADDEAAAIEIVGLHEGVAMVQDGLIGPGHHTPNLAEHGAIGPLTFHEKRVGEKTAAERILGAAHTEDRVFDSDSRGTPLSTGTAVVTK